MSLASPLDKTAGASPDPAVQLVPGELAEPTFRYWSPLLLMLIPAWLVAAALLLDDPGAAFRENWPLFFVGVVGAIVGNATAVGGGLVFVPFTMLVYGIDPVSSLKLAIACQAFGMTSGAVAWWRRGRVPRRAFVSILPAIGIGCLVGGIVIPVEASVVKGLFGPVSCAIGLSTLLMLNVSLPNIHDRSTPGLHVAAVFGGILTAWVAIGIGEAIAAFLMLRQRVCAERSIALGVAALSVASICLLAIFALTGPMPWPQTSCMALGCILGGRLAPLLSRRVSQYAIKLVFGVVALADGAMFIYFYTL